MPAPATSHSRTGTRPASYLPRRPDETVLYRVVAGDLESFLARARRRGKRVPRFVEREFRNFLDCGIPSHGFLRVRCDACGCERLVPFSCKGRGFCCSCAGRRMADTAAHLVDRVLPVAPVRQWVLTLPWGLRYRMAYDAGLTSDVLRLFVRTIFCWLRRGARARGFGGPLRCGAVTFVQRFGDALNLNVHFHTLALDGVYASDERFHSLPPPDDAEVAKIARRVTRGVARLLRRRGLGSDADLDEVDPLAREQPWLAALCSASVRGRIATGERAGQAVLRFGDRIDPETLENPNPSMPRCATVAGVSIHANVCVPARDRRRLERLCRYVARPPVATERLQRLPDGRLSYRLRRRWRDGTTHIVFEPLELIEKLAALVPPPRANLVRYHGVLGPAARQRQRVVPRPAANLGTACGHGGSRTKHRVERPRPGGTASAAATTPRSTTVDKQPTRPPRKRSRVRRYSWPELMRRVFAVDVLECPRCSGAMRILAAIHSPDAAPAILECLGLPARPEPSPPDADDGWHGWSEIDDGC